MSLIYPDDVTAMGADNGLSETVLFDLIAREEAELVRRFGANYTALTTVSQTKPGGKQSIYLTRPIGTVSSVSEYLYLGDTAPQALVENTDYVVWADQGRLERLGGCWGPKVTVAFIPTDDTNLRRQVLIELVRIAAAQETGGKVSGLGYSIEQTNTARDWHTAREAQYSRLAFIGV